MGRLQLVILDSDKAFVDSLAALLRSNYAHRFHTSCFTTREAFDDCFMKENLPADIILVNPQMYTEDLSTGKLPVVILLTAGRTARPVSHIASINRYQRIDALVAGILKIFTEKNDDQIFEAEGYSGTKAVGMFSAAGGAGKTSLALACSVQWVRAGFTVFYLNLEPVPTTASILRGTNDAGLSQVLYHIKSKSPNIHLKIEGLRDISSEYGIHFFQPPFSCMELEEASGDDLVEIVRHIKALGQYSAILIDMGAGIDSRSASLMNACDEIVILAAGQDTISIVRTNCLLREISMQASGSGKKFAERITIVVNRCSPEAAVNLEAPSGCRGIFRIPSYDMGINGFKPDSMLDSAAAGPAVRQICETLMR